MNKSEKSGVILQAISLNSRRDEEEEWDQEEDIEDDEGIEYLDQDEAEIFDLLRGYDDENADDEVNAEREGNLRDFLVHYDSEDESEHTGDEEDMDVGEVDEETQFKPAKDGTIWQKFPVLLSRKAPAHNTIRGPLNKVKLPPGNDETSLIIYSYTNKK